MIEKYEVAEDQWGYSVVEDGVGVIAFFKSSPAGCMAKEDAQRLLLKLNRLADLQAVCGEIVDSAPLADDNNTGDLYEDGLNDAKWDIAQKLKAVLGEK